MVRRYRKNLTQTEAAHEVGIGFSTYQQAESTALISKGVKQAILTWLKG
jgi:DNA-directed RNA polymerase specialized sigma subunit